MALLKVLGKEGQCVLIRHGEAFYRIHPCHLIKPNKELGSLLKLPCLKIRICRVKLDKENKTRVLLEKKNRRLILFYRKESYTKQLLGLSNLIYLFLTPPYALILILVIISIHMRAQFKKSLKSK